MKNWIHILFILSITGCAENFSFDAYFKTRKGIQHFKEENKSQAQAEFMESLQEAPLRFENHINLGVSFESLGVLDKARKSYFVAHSLAKDPLHQFISSFNLGEIFAKEKKIDEALTYYQKALDVHPDSQEAKVNIELLMQSQQNQQQNQNGDNKDNKEQESGKDKKDQDKDNKDQDKDKNKEEQKKYGQQPKYKPRPFKGELPENDVKKILDELKNQEQKIRADYNRKEMKERPRGKDW